MIRLAAAAVAVLGTGFQDGAQPAHEDVTSLVHVIVAQQVVIHVPRVQTPGGAPAAPGLWRETSGPRCIAAEAIAGALPAADSVDIVLKDDRRFRAEFAQRCMGLNYYRGLYLTANPDGQICAGRDVIRTRMGGQCGIVEFKTLRPARR